MAKRFRNNFTFGNIAAEGDFLLSTAFLDTGDFDTIESHEDKRCFIIGRTGSGKSAAFQELEKKFPDKVIRIDPESLSLPYILNINIMQDLLSYEVHLDPFLKALWKHVIVVEILRHRYNIDSPEKKRYVLQILMDKLRRDPGKVKALEYVNNFGDKFWCETDERVKQVADTFVEKLGFAGEAGVTLPSASIKASGNKEHTFTQETKKEITNKYQTIVNDMQMPQLNHILNILNNTILDSEQHFTYLIIDDLDKEWVDEDLAILLIKCLFQAVVDMQKTQNLKILVALRTNIFNQLNYGKQTRGGQEEKFRGLALDLRWNTNDLKSLLEKRAKVASKYYQLETQKTLIEMLPNIRNRNTNNPLTYILEHTLMRPRDAILFLNCCVREAAGKDKISWENIYHAEKTYSQDRLLALRDEWKDPYLGIDKIFQCFQRAKSKLSRDEITPIFDEIALLLLDKDFEGGKWLNNLSNKFYDLMYNDLSVNNSNWNDIYKSLANLLYSISFIGIARNNNSKIIYSYEEHGLLYITEDLSESTYFEVHPAFHQALNLIITR